MYCTGDMPILIVTCHQNSHHPITTLQHALPYLYTYYDAMPHKTVPKYQPKTQLQQCMSDTLFLLITSCQLL